MNNLGKIRILSLVSLSSKSNIWFFGWIIKFVNIEKQIQTNGSMPKVPGIFGTDIASAFPFGSVMSIVWSIHTIGVWQVIWLLGNIVEYIAFCAFFHFYRSTACCLLSSSRLKWNIFYCSFPMFWCLLVYDLVTICCFSFYALIQDVYRSSLLAYHEFMTMSMHVARFLLFISNERGRTFCCPWLLLH